MDIKNVTADDSSCPKTILLRALQNSALSGGDKISSNGYCQKVKNIVSYIRCQCSQIYEEATTKDGTYRQDLLYVNNKKTTELEILESMESKELLLHYQEIKKKHVGSI